MEYIIIYTTKLALGIIRVRTGIPKLRREMLSQV